MTAISTVVADLAELAVRWVRGSRVPMSTLVRRRIEGYLRGPDCATLLELLFQLEYTEREAVSHAAERARLREAFCRELQRAVRHEVKQSYDFAFQLWGVIERNVPFHKVRVDARDRIVIRVTGPERPISERLGLALDSGRRAASRATGVLIREAMGRAHDRMVMPHSRADFRFPVDRIYVPRTLCPKDALGPIGEDEVIDRRFVLVGNPGAGKSTFIRRLVHRTAASGTLVPLLVQLKQHQQMIDDFVTIIARELRPSAQRVVPRQHIADLLDAGEAVVVFDGLDEVGDIHARRAAAQAIEAFSARFPLARIVVTCREESYPVATLDATTFPVYRLPDFDSVQVEQYARTWFSLVHAEGRETAFLRDSEHVLDVRSNPLMLSLLCMLYQSDGYIPENTVDVYRECAELMLVRWDAVTQVPSVIRSVKLAKFLVQELAQHFFFELDGQGDEGEKTLERLVVAHLQEREEEGTRSYHQQARDFLDYCAERAWVLTQVDTSRDGERRFGFTHRTFMEYYTACYVLRTCGTAEEIVERLLPMITSGKSSVVPQIALQMYDMNRADGGDACVRMFVEATRREPEVSAVLAVLRFCVRFLEHNNLRRATTVALLEDSFEALGRTGDRYLLAALKAVRLVKRTRTATVARAVLARSEPGTESRLGAGMVVRTPSVAFEVALGETRYGIEQPMRFTRKYGAASMVYARLPGCADFVPGPAVGAAVDGQLRARGLMRHLATSWPDVLPIPASVLPAIYGLIREAGGTDSDGTRRGCVAMITAAAFEAGLVPLAGPDRLTCAAGLLEYCGDFVDALLVCEHLKLWAHGEMAFVDPSR